MVEELLEVLHKRQCSLDLALMALGNAVSHILAEQVPAQQREAITHSFINALQSATSTKG